MSTALRMGGAENLGELGEVGCEELSEVLLPATSVWSREEKLACPREELACPRSCELPCGWLCTCGRAPGGGSTGMLTPHFPQVLER